MDTSKVFAYTLEFPGTTKEQYDQVIEKLNLGGKTAPGGIFHLATVTASGVKVFDVWESKEAFDKFMSEKLGPVMKELAIQVGQPEIWSVHNVLDQ